MVMEKIFAIGDIHGCFDKLIELMDTINVDFDMDRLIFLGDYIDRGPESYNVMEYLIELKSRHNNIVFLKGNHEEMLENYISGTDRLAYLANGGHTTVDSYINAGITPKKNLLPEGHVNFLKSLDLFYETDNYIFVHAGLREKIPLKKQVPEDLLWIRRSFVKSSYDFGKRVVFGHTPLPEPLVQKNKIGIDTGAVYGKKLTCVELPELNFYSV